MEVIDATRGTTAEEVKRQILDGWSFIHDEPDAIPALWGDGDRVVWPEGESLVIAGGRSQQTTLAGQVVTALIGAGDSEVLDLPVSRVNRVLYLAMDRPRQAARSLRRQLGSAGQDQMARLAGVEGSTASGPGEPHTHLPDWPSWRMPTWWWSIASKDAARVD